MSQKFGDTVVARFEYLQAFLHDDSLPVLVPVRQVHHVEPLPLHAVGDAGVHEQFLRGTGVVAGGGGLRGGSSRQQAPL